MCAFVPTLGNTQSLISPLRCNIWYSSIGSNLIEAEIRLELMKIDESISLRITGESIKVDFPFFSKEHDRRIFQEKKFTENHIDLVEIWDGWEMTVMFSLHLSRRTGHLNYMEVNSRDGDFKRIRGRCEPFGQKF